MRLKFVEIDSENLLLASLIQLKIFGFASSFDSYEDCALHGARNGKYFLVFCGKKPIGVTGFCPDNKQKDECWVAWLGLLSSERGKGYGKIILEQTLSFMKDSGYKTARLYTSRKWNADAQFLYKKVMDLEEEYRQEGEAYLHYVVFSKSLSNEPVLPFGNRNLNLQQAEKEDKLAVRHLKKYIKNHISKLDNDGTDSFEFLRSKIMPNDFPLFEIKSKRLMLSMFKHQKYDVLLLKENNEIWAYAILYNCKNGYSMLDYFAVKEDLRGLGLGSLFLEQVVSEYNNVVIELDPFDLKNEKDIGTRRFKFYEKLSFKLTNLIALLHKKHKYVIAALTATDEQKSELKNRIIELYGEVYNSNEFEII